MPSRIVKKRALISLRDLFLLFYTPIFLLLAWILPERGWPSIVRFYVFNLFALRRLRFWLRQTFKPGQPAGSKRSPAALENENLRRQLTKQANTTFYAHLANLYVFRALRPGRWQPQIEFKGREHIDQALTTNKGVILWVAPFRFSALLSKVALCQAGYDLIHLSLSDHGISKTRFGVRYINWVWVTAENRFLHQRIVMDTDDRKPALRELSQQVRAKNNPISITFVNTGKRIYEGEIMGVKVRAGAGAVTLAYHSDSALLPVFTVFDDHGGFNISVYPSLSPASYSNKESAGQGCINQYLEIAQSYKQKYPTQTLYW